MMISTTHPFSLEGKTILVTGASSGIGRSIAIESAKMGATVICTGRNEARLADTLNLLYGNEHKMIVSDLSTEEGIEKIVKNLPKLDGLVLAAGIVEMWPVLFASRKRIDKIFNVNFLSPIEVIRIIIKKKLYNDRFSIVAIDSIAGSSDFKPGNAIYGSGKSALASFLKYVSLETASKGIRVNTVSPGWINTPMHKTENESVDMDTIINDVPMKRWGTPEDVAYSTIFLLSNAASYITGTDIKIDGGYSLV